MTEYKKRVMELENEGLCTSDAQGAATVELAQAAALSLLDALKEVLQLMDDTIESCGGYKEFFACDHSVGICACGEKQVLREAKGLVYHIEGIENDSFIF